jgi:glycosyltransferase involved in cell wall biosynthesis
MLRVAYLLSHPIQYQSPLLRRLDREPGLHLTVFYTSDFSLHAYRDRGFGASVEWDVPLLGGYRHEVLPRLLDGSEITFSRPLARGISRRLRQGRFDALWVHGYATLNSWIAMMAAKRLGIPVLLRTDSTLIDHPRGPIKLALKKIFFNILRRFVYGVLTVGEKNADYWRHHLREDIPLFPVPYAVDNCFFEQRCRAAAATREDLRRELRLEPDRPVILFASKLLARKRCMDLVEAFFQSRAQRNSGTRQENQPYLLIVGDGEERAHIEARLRTGGEAANDVRMVGFQNQSELPRYYDLCDIFVLPSVYEPWGLAVNEVMNAGRPVILSDEVGCQPDLVIDEENGFVFRARDVGSLANALERALAQPGRLRIMGERSRERIQHFSFEADAQGLMRAFIAARSSHRVEAAVETR